MTKEKDVTIEVLQSEYLNKEELQAPPVELSRIESHNIRIYYGYNEGVLEFFPGVTGFLSKVLPTPKELIDWLVEKGAGAAAYVKERTCYGSIMHGQFVPLLIDNKYELDSTYDIINQACRIARIQVDEVNWSRELKKDVLAFAQWMDEYKVVPLAIEVPLITRKYGIATLVDLVCKMTISTKGFWGEEYKTGERKGDPKETKEDREVYAVVDFKSRKKPYVTRADELQLAYGVEMVKENYPELKDKEFRMFSWHPKDWKTAPGSHFTEHTSKHTIRELELYSEIYYLTNDVYRYSRMSFQGTVEVGGDLTDNYTTRSLSEIIDLREIEEAKLTKKENNETN